MPERFINPVPQYADSGNGLIPSGILVFLETGTATAKNVFADPGLITSLGNQVSLDGAGRVPNIWLNGSYKVRLHKFSGDDMDPLGTQLWERDPVGGNTTGAGQDWAAGNIYGLDDIVKGSNGKYYISIIANNLGSDPTSTPAAWSELQWFQLWNTNATYAIDDLVKGSDGLIYTSLVGSNQGNDPTTDDLTNWERSATRPETAIQGQITHNMASDADYTLTALQAQKAIIKITDTGTLLTTGRNIIAPDAAREWTFVNGTLQTLTLKTLAGTGIAVLVGDSGALKSDGTNVAKQVNDSTASAGNVVHESVVSGSAVTTIDVSGLDIATDRNYRIVLEIENTAGTLSGYELTVQGDHTLANYYSQILSVIDTAIVSARSNTPEICQVNANETGTTEITLTQLGGVPSATAMTRKREGALVELRQYAVSKTASIANITSLRITSTIAGALGIGTKLTIYRG